MQTYLLAGGVKPLAAKTVRSAGGTALVAVSAMAGLVAGTAVAGWV